MYCIKGKKTCLETGATCVRMCLEGDTDYRDRDRDREMKRGNEKTKLCSMVCAGGVPPRDGKCFDVTVSTKVRTSVSGPLQESRPNLQGLRSVVSLLLSPAVPKLDDMLPGLVFSVFLP